MKQSESGFQLEDKGLLITGGDGGIGKGIALRFASYGVNIVFTWHRNRKRAEETEKLIKSKGVSVLSLQCDVTVCRDIENTVRKAKDFLQTIDILVNNAGIYPVSPFFQMSEKEWDETMDTNLKGVHFFTRTVAETMKKQKTPGSIINIASIEGEDPAAGHAHYDASKGGLIIYTRAAALELAHQGIRVNAISPGLIWNEGIEESWPDGVNRYLKAVPLGRLGMPEDIADACLFFASPFSRWITGVNLRVDGGLQATSRY